MTPPSPSGRPTRRSASYIASLTLAGRVVERAGAFGQILLVAAFFGATTSADLYFIASIAPLMIGGILGEGLHVSILPALARSEGDDLRAIVRAGFWVSLGLLSLVTVVYLGVAAAVVAVAEPAGSAALAPWAAFAPIGVLLGLGSYLAAVLLRLERYVWPPFRSAASTLVALGLSAVALALGAEVVWVALAVTAGYAVACLLLAVEVVATAGGAMLGLPSRASVAELAPLRRRFATAVAGGIIGGQIFVLAERALAASLGVGAVAAISYARGVAFTPGVVAQSISLGLYPGMLRAHAAGDVEDLRRSYIGGLRITLFVALCTAAYLMLNAGSVAGALFGDDGVGAESLAEIERTLAAFGPAVVGSMLMIYVGRTLNAIDRFAGIVVSQGIALAVFLPLGVALRPLLGPAGLALAFGAAELAGAAYGIAACSRGVGADVRDALHALGSAAVRAGWVALALLAARFLYDPDSDWLAALGGLAVGVPAALALLWWSEWPEVAGMRRLARRS